MKKIAVLTTGGDAPGMNPAIRSVVRYGISQKLEVMGVFRGWWGLINEELKPLNQRSVSGIIGQGGTILKTARCSEFRTEEGQRRAYETIKKHNIDGLVAITGEVVQNSYFKEVIKAASDGVRAGEGLSVEFIRREDLYPAFVGEMMSVGEETGETNEMLKRLALFFEEEVDRKTKDMSTIIEPFLMLFMGAAVGFFAVSMISPIYALSQNIN